MGYSLGACAMMLSLATAGYISAPVSITRPHQLAKRDVFGAFVASNTFYYTVEIGIGSPAQPIKAVLDTGSADLWVLKGNSPFCQGNQHFCAHRSFDTNASSTFHQTDQPFSIKYGDMSTARGNWVNDNVELAGAVLENTTFAIAEFSNSTQIVMGVGLPALESTVGGADTNGDPKGSYNNIPQLFKNQGHIERVAYSLWLNGIDSTGGEVLFGGVDAAKFIGNLSIVPLVNLSKKLKHPYSFHIMINGLTIDTDNGSSRLVDLAYPALLDSGTSFAYLPPPFVKFLAKPIGYHYHNESGYYIGECAAVKNKVLYLNFSGTEFPIPYSSIVMPYSESDPTTCAMVVLPSEDEYSTILGDVFLRNMYVVFDLESYEVGFAPAKVNATDSDIMVITEGIPGIRAPLYDRDMPIRNLSIAGANPEHQLRKEQSTNSAPTVTPGTLLSLVFICLYFI